MPFKEFKKSPPAKFTYRYVKGFMCDHDFGDGQVKRVAADSDDKLIYLNREFRLAAFSVGSNIALFKAHLRATHLPTGWTALTLNQYKAEFAALMGRQPTAKEL